MHWDHLGMCNGSKPVSFTKQHICNRSSKNGEISAGLCKASLPHHYSSAWMWLLSVRKFSVRKYVFICSSLAKHTCVIKNMLPQVCTKYSATSVHTKNNIQNSGKIQNYRFKAGQKYNIKTCTFLGWCMV